MNEYQEKMKNYAERMEEYVQRAEKYNKKVAKHNQKIIEKFGKNQKVIKNKKEKTPNMLCCSVCRDQGEYKVQPGDINCRNCGRQLVERSILHEKEDKKWG
jgi:peptidyl-tRNA hydrolase